MYIGGMCMFWCYRVTDVLLFFPYQSYLECVCLCVCVRERETPSHDLALGVFAGEGPTWANEDFGLLGKDVCLCVCVCVGVFSWMFLLIYGFLRVCASGCM